MKPHECDKGPLLEIIGSDVKELKEDVKSLLKFKYQIVGGAGVIGTILALLVNLIIK